MSRTSQVGHGGARRIAAFGVVFSLGVMVGAVSLSVLAASSLEMYRELVRLDYAAQHEFLAARAERRGNDLEANGHRWAVVYARRGDGWSEPADLTLVRRMSFAFAAPVLKRVRHSTDAVDRGRKVAEGIAWARLAASMEEIGLDDESAAVWARGASLVGHDEYALRAAVESMSEFGSSDLHAAAEEVILKR